MPDEPDTMQRQVLAIIDVDTKRRFNLANKDLISIGRDAENDVPLSDDPAASSCHALVTRSKGNFWIEDLGTVTGTFVNHNPVEKPVMLKVGDSILIGRTRFTVE